METRADEQTLDGIALTDPDPDPGDDCPTDAYLGLRPRARARRRLVPALSRWKRSRKVSRVAGCG